MSLPVKPSRIDFNSIDINSIQAIARTGDLDRLPEAERRYYDLMEMVRGLRARMLMPGGERISTKAGIIKLLKSSAYGLSDWMARRVYADAINFFYQDTEVTPRAWANLYAEKLEKWADLAAVSGRLGEAKSHLVEAAKLRRCYEDPGSDVPAELLEQSPVVIYTADAESVGAPRTDRRRLEQFISGLPDLSEDTRDRLREDAGLKRRDTRRRLIDVIKEFGDEDS